MRRKIEINVNVDKQLCEEELAEYVYEQLRYGGGDKPPSHPLFDGLNIARLRVTGKDYPTNGEDL